MKLFQFKIIQIRLFWIFSKKISRITIDISRIITNLLHSINNTIKRELSRLAKYRQANRNVKSLCNKKRLVAIFQKTKIQKKSCIISCHESISKTVKYTEIK
jgi:hypothetical protein